MRTSMKPSLIVAALLPLVALPFGQSEPAVPADFAAGARAYREGRFAQALAAFTAVAAERGDGTSPELLYNLALAALRAGAVREAEAAAEKAAVRGGGEFVARREFLLGSTAWWRCERAELQAASVEAEPFAYDVAILHGETARRHWQAAILASRADWPQARRNVERALRKRDELRRKKAEAVIRKQKERQPRVRILQSGKGEEPPPLATEERDTGRQEAAEAQRQDAATVQRLLERLEAKEKEKRELRRGRQATLPAGAERDW